jgi:hypothetical protein
MIRRAFASAAVASTHLILTMIANRAINLLVVALLLSSRAAAQAPWNRSPALPTACYTKGEEFIAVVQRMRDAIGEEIQKQADINSAIKAKVGEIDAGTKQARMMAFLQKDPAAASKVMQDMSTAGQRNQPAVDAMNARKQELEEQLAAINKRHDTEHASATGGLEQQLRAELDPSGNAAKARTLGAQLNAAYQGHCAKWWTESSPYRAYLSALKEYHEQHAIPVAEEGARIDKAALDLYGVPHTGFKSVAPLQAVHDYLGAVFQIYQKRRLEPART